MMRPAFKVHYLRGYTPDGKGRYIYPWRITERTRWALSHARWGFRRATNAHQTGGLKCAVQRTWAASLNRSFAFDSVGIPGVSEKPSPLPFFENKKELTTFLSREKERTSFARRARSVLKRKRERESLLCRLLFLFIVIIRSNLRKYLIAITRGERWRREKNMCDARGTVIGLYYHTDVKPNACAVFLDSRIVR